MFLATGGRQNRKPARSTTSRDPRLREPVTGGSSRELTSLNTGGGGGPIRWLLPSRQSIRGDAVDVHSCVRHHAGSSLASSRRWEEFHCRSDHADVRITGRASASADRIQPGPLVPVGVEFGVGVLTTCVAFVALGEDREGAPNIRKTPQHRGGWVR